MAFGSNKQKLVIEGENKTKRAFGGIMRAMRGLGQQAARVGKGIAIGLGAGAAGLIALTKQTLDQADALGKLSAQTGLTVEELQKYQFAAGQTGTSQQLFNTGMQAFGKRLGELKSGGGSLLTFLNKYDEELAKNLQNTNSTGEALRMLADEMGNIEDPATRAALGAAAFSRSAGVALGNTLSGGSEALNQYGTELEKTGSIMTEKGVKASEAFKDAMDKLSRSTLGAFRKAITDMAPQLQEWAEMLAEKAPAAIQELVKWLQEAGPSFKSFVSGVGTAIEVMKTVVGTIGVMIENIIGYGKAVRAFVDGVVETFTDMKNKAVNIVKDMIESITKWFTNPLDSIVDSTKGAVEKVVGWFQWGADEAVNQSIIPDMVIDIGGWMDKLPGLMGDPAETATSGVLDKFGTLRDGIRTILSDIIDGTKSFGESLKSVLGGIADNIIGKSIDRVSDAITSGIASSFSGSGGFLGGAAKALFGGGGATTTAGAGGSVALAGGTASGISGVSVTGGSAGAGLGGGSAGFAMGPMASAAAAAAILFAQSEIISAIRGASSRDKALKDLQRAGPAVAGGLGLSATAGDKFGFGMGANAGFAAEFGKSQIGNRAGLAGDGLAVFEGLNLDATVKMLDQAQAKFEALKRTAASTFSLGRQGAAQVGKALQDGFVDKTELADLGFIALGERIENTKSGVVKMGELSIEQFEAVMGAVDKNILRMEALRGETALNAREMRFFAEEGLMAAGQVQTGFEVATGAMRSFGQQSVASLREIEGAARSTRNAVAGIGGEGPAGAAAREDPVVNEIRGLRDDTRRNELRRLYGGR